MQPLRILFVLVPICVGGVFRSEQKVNLMKQKECSMLNDSTGDDSLMTDLSTDWEGDTIVCSTPISKSDTDIRRRSAFKPRSLFDNSSFEDPVGISLNMGSGYLSSDTDLENMTPMKRKLSSQVVEMKNNNSSFEDPVGISLNMGRGYLSSDTDLENMTPMKRKLSSQVVEMKNNNSSFEDPVGISLNMGSGYLSSDTDLENMTPMKRKLSSQVVEMKNSIVEDPVGVSLDMGSGYLSSDTNLEDMAPMNRKTPSQRPLIITSEVTGSKKMKDKALQVKNIAKTKDVLCCDKKCNKLFTFSDIFNLRTDYWSKSQSGKQSFLIWLLKESHFSGKKRIFSVNKKSLCTTAFLKLFRINKNTLSKAVSLKNQNAITGCAKKPRSMTKGTLNAINFLDWYSKYYGDKMPHSNEVLLPYVIKKKRIYEDFKKKHCNEKAYVSVSQFHLLWKRHFSYVKIRKTSTFSKCSVCTGFEREMEKTTDVLMRSRLQNARHDHLDRQMLERAYYYKKREMSQNDPDTYMSIIVDGMDQSKSSLPHFAGRLPKFINVGDLMKCHITGVLNHGEEKFDTFIDFNQYSHDPNLTINVILKTLLSTSKAKGNRLPGTLYIQADNCSRENKNRYVLAFLELLARERIFNQVHLSFLMVGHTHEDVDAGFSKIADKLKVQDAETIPELMNVIKAVGQKYSAKQLDKMLNVRDFLSPHINTIDQITQPLHFKFVSTSYGVNVFTKDLQHSEWIRHEVNILNSVPVGRPKPLEISHEKISIESIKKSVNTVKNYFKGLFSMLWWNNFLDKITNCDNSNIEWIDHLPRQTDLDDLPLPEHIQVLVDKEQEKRPMTIRQKKNTVILSEQQPAKKRKNTANKGPPKESRKQKGGRKRLHLIQKTTGHLILLDNEEKRHIWMKIFLDICIYIFTVSVLLLCMVIIYYFISIYSLLEFLDSIHSLFCHMIYIHMGNLFVDAHVQTYMGTSSLSWVYILQSICVERKYDERFALNV